MRFGMSAVGARADLATYVVGLGKRVVALAGCALPARLVAGLVFRHGGQDTDHEYRRCAHDRGSS